MPEMDAEAYDRLVDFLATDPRVRIIYAFGSAANGSAGPLSDVDLAVLLDSPPDLEAESDLRARVAEVVPHVDLVILNQAPSALRYEILTGGRCLLARSPREQAEFEITSLSRFLDFQPMRRVQQDYLRNRVEERRGSAT